MKEIYKWLIKPEISRIALISMAVLYFLLGYTGNFWLIFSLLIAICIAYLVDKKYSSKE